MSSIRFYYPRKLRWCTRRCVGWSIYGSWELGVGVTSSPPQTTLVSVALGAGFVAGNIVTAFPKRLGVVAAVIRAPGCFVVLSFVVPWENKNICTLNSSQLAKTRIWAWLGPKPFVWRFLVAIFDLYYQLQWPKRLTNNTPPPPFYFLCIRVKHVMLLLPACYSFGCLPILIL